MRWSRRIGARSVAIAGLSLALPGVGHADLFLRPWESKHEPKSTFALLPEFNFYTTNTNFNASGVKVEPAGLEKYTRLQSDVQMAYGLTHRLTIFGRFSWVHIQVEHATLTGDAFGLTDQSAGVAFRAWESIIPLKPRGISLDLQFQSDFPAYSNSVVAGSNVPFLGDGSINLTFGGFLTVPLEQNRSASWLLSGGGGYTYRTSDFSTALPYMASIRFEPRDEGPLATAMFYGFQSLRTDPKAVTGSTSSAGVGGGGSFFVNAINPSYLAARVQGGYQFDPRISALAGASYPLWGQAAPAGLALTLSLSARWGGDVRAVNPLKMSPQDYGKSNQGFVNYAFEGHVLRSSDKLNLVKIDKGNQDGVELGQIFDIFLVKPDGSVGEAVARAKCKSTKINEASLEVIEHYKEIWIDEGFIVKRPLQ